MVGVGLRSNAVAFACWSCRRLTVIGPVLHDAVDRAHDVLHSDLVHDLSPESAQPNQRGEGNPKRMYEATIHTADVIENPLSSQERAPRV
jgi:hypothetical protein